jgi:phosphate starvation-inducible PhoH-like protein
MQKAIHLRDKDELAQVLGVYDRNLRTIRNHTGAKILLHDSEIRIQGGRKSVEKAYFAFLKVRQVVGAQGQISEEDLNTLLVNGNGQAKTEEVVEVVAPRRQPTGGIFRQGARVDPKTPGQQHYFSEIDKNEIVFTIGPAGTGKTFMAVAKAVEALKSGQVRRLVLVRPAVEAGERLGFLPGDIEAKVNPYLRPIYDALNFHLEFGQLRRLIDNDVIEIAPLAFMRGRTLDESFIILDEAQNTTGEQMKMFLTRMGQKSKVVVTGDITQIDIPSHKTSGLIEAMNVLKGIVGISFVTLGQEDIVRHPLVQRIVLAYDRKGPKTR